jgi:hypothetical protein
MAESIIANSIQVDTIVQLFIKKGYITKEEFFDKLKKVQAKYEKKNDSDSSPV